jgi:hypothetical protein
MLKTSAERYSKLERKKTAKREMAGKQNFYRRYLRKRKESKLDFPAKPKSCCEGLRLVYKRTLWRC